MTRFLFLLTGLCLLTACAKEPATQPGNPNSNASATATPTPNNAATSSAPMASSTPAPNAAAAAAAANDTAWQKDFNAVVPFVKRHLQAGADPEQLITNQTVHWSVTFRKFIPGSDPQNPFSPHALIDFAEAAAAAKERPWIQIVAWARDSESEKLKALRAGARINLRCQMGGVTLTEKNEKKGRSLEGMALSAENCVIE